MMTNVLTQKDASDVIAHLQSSGKPYCGFEVLNALLDRAGASSYAKLEPLEHSKIVYSWLVSSAEKGEPLKITHCYCSLQEIPKNGPIELKVDCGYFSDPTHLTCVMKNLKYRNLLPEAILNEGGNIEVYGTPRKDNPNVIDTDILIFYKDVWHSLFSEEAFNQGASID